MKSDEMKYDIKKILNEWIIDGVQIYLIKWLEYEELKNSWESEINLN